MIQKAKEKNDDVLLVDAGNWAEVQRKFDHEDKSAFIWKMMGMLGYDATTPGDRELALGMGDLTKLLATEPDVQVVSANITDKSGSLVWDKYAIIERGGTRFGVTGVTGGSAYAFNLTRGTQKSDDFDFLDSEESLREVIPELKQKADVVVVLLHETPGDARRIVDELPGMDVVIVGHNPGYMFNPDRLANTLLVRGGNRGQYLSVLELTLDGDNSIVDYNGEGKPLGKTVAKEAAVDAVVVEWEKDYNEREQAHKRKEAVGKAMLHGTESFIGAEKCQRCHATEYTEWAESAHAGGTLSQELDLPLAEGVEASGVQCEHCHGLGTFHGTMGFENEVSEETCNTCHSAEGLDPVDYAQALADGVHR